jgi:4-aminobutyrate aminotransferase
VFHAPFGSVADLDYFEEVLFDKIVPANEVAAIIVEPIQGEGGYIIPEDGFLAGLRELCDRHGILLIADEIQSGAGRTGTMWAIEHWGVEPDILLSAKGLASGMPLSAVVAKAPIMEAWDAGAHGSTYGGNPVACAAALATLELLEGELIDNAAARGRQGLEALGRIQDRQPGTVESVRGMGLMLAVELPTPALAEALQWESFTRGLLVLGCGKRAVRVSPPLVIDEATMASGLTVLEEAIEAAAGGGPGRQERPMAQVVDLTSARDTSF